MSLSFLLSNRRHEIGSHVVMYDSVQQRSGLFQIATEVGMDDGTGLHICWLHFDYSDYNITGDFTLGPYCHSFRALGRIRRQYVPEYMIFNTIKYK